MTSFNIYHSTYNIRKVEMKTENKIQDLAFDFSLQVIELYKILVKQNEYVLSKQLLRSATSIGANVEEANAAQSKKEFT